LGCDETAQSLREHICFSTPWYMHCSNYWSRLLNELEDPERNSVELDPENEDINKKKVIDSIQF
jgi:hypothetical protein